MAKNKKMPTKENAEIEKSNCNSGFVSKCFTIVVLPEPDGAEKTNSLPVLMF